MTYWRPRTVSNMTRSGDATHEVIYGGHRKVFICL